MTSLQTLEGIWKARPGGLAFAEYAEGLLLAGRKDEAAQVAQEGVRRWPKNLPGRILQGRIAREKGDFEAARSSFQSALDLDGSSRAALEGLAEASGAAQYLRQAYEVWGRLAALEPNHPQASSRMRTLAQSLDKPAGLDAVALVRAEEDASSREALSEGANTHSTAGLTQPTIPAFHLDLGEPSSMGVAGFAAPRLDAPTIPELPGFNIPSAVGTPPPSPSLLGRVEESSFATLEMPSFPSGGARTIPPPPLDVPHALSAPPPPAPLPPIEEAATRPELPPPAARGHFPAEMDQFDGEATQFIGKPKPGSATQGIERVTSDDVAARFDEYFGKSDFPKPPSSPGPIPVHEVPPTVTDMPVVAAGSEKVTGKDVVGRLDELFGETTPPPPLSVPPLPEPSVHPKATPAAPAGVVSGDDIEGRLDDLFGESVIDLTGPISTHEHQKSGETSSLPREVMATGVPSNAGDTAALARDTTLEARLQAHNASQRPAESTTELHLRDLKLDADRLVSQAAKGSETDYSGSTIDLPALDASKTSAEPRPGARLTAEDVDSRLDELFASSEFFSESAPQSTGRTGFVPRAPAPAPNAHAGVVTGDDVEGRLDDLFGGDSDFPVSLPTVTFAEEYLRQGHRDKAASIYRQLLEKDPSNADLRRRLGEIEKPG